MKSPLPASRPAPSPQPVELLRGRLGLSPQSYLDPLIEDREVGICLQLLRGGKNLTSQSRDKLESPPTRTLRTAPSHEDMAVLLCKHREPLTWNMFP